MGVRVLHNADDTEAVMYCSVSGWAFGPVFHDNEHETASDSAKTFINWLHEKGMDPRMSDSEIEKQWALWFKEVSELFREVEQENRARKEAQR